jgi:hypothetical protein
VKRQLLLLVLVAVIAAAPACATAERPEGVVERWLISLNQGAAGHPDRYAPAWASETVVPAWRDLEPGELDLIEVGAARRAPDGAALVPFQIEDRNGTVTRAFAVVEERDATPRIVGFEPPPDSGPGLDPGFALRSADGARPVAWLAAFAIAIGLIVLTVGLMRLAPEPSTELRTRRAG